LKITKDIKEMIKKMIRNLLFITLKLARRKKLLGNKYKLVILSKYRKINLFPQICSFSDHKDPREHALLKPKAWMEKQI